MSKKKAAPPPFYMVTCLTEGRKRTMVRRDGFSSLVEAEKYAAGIHESREPAVYRLVSVIHEN